MDKTQLRRYIREQKRAMSEEEIVRRSARLAQMFAATPAYQAAKTIYGYLSYNQEVRTMPILEQALRDGKRVAVPKVYGEEMRFLYLDDLSLVAKGYGGIPEPIADEPVADDKTALVLMPGLAFDRSGGRLGRGGGYYDRWLAGFSGVTAALCRDGLLMESIPRLPHDLGVNLVVTETGLYGPSAPKQEKSGA